MKTNGFVYKKYAGMTVCTQTQEEPDLKVLHGRVVIDESDWKMLFVQNKPRGARSVEVGRTAHSRYVRRPDGRYTVTFRFNAREALLQQTLLREMRVLLKAIQEDRRMLMMEGDDDEGEWR